MTLLQTPREHSQRLTVLQGFYAYRLVTATEGVQHTQDALVHAFGNHVKPLDYADPRFASLSRVAIVSQAQGARMVRRAHRKSRNLGEFKEAYGRAVDFTARKDNEAVDTCGYVFDVTQRVVEGAARHLVVSLRAQEGHDIITKDARGIAGAVAGYSRLALVTKETELSFPLALVDCQAVAEEIDASCMTRFVHVPLSPLIVER